MVLILVGHAVGRWQSVGTVAYTRGLKTIHKCQQEIFVEFSE